MGTITIDIRMFSYSGIGTYLQNIVPRIINKFSEHSFYLLSNNHKDFCDFSNFKNCKSILLNSRIYSFQEQFELIQKTPSNTDLFWSPHFNIPLFFKKKLLVTIHDIIPLVLPEFKNNLRKRLYANYFFKKISQKASGIIFVSHFTKSEFEKNTSTIKNSKVIYHGVDSFWTECDSQNNSDIQSPYFLFVGNFKPHKNLHMLIEAFALIAKYIPHKLVLAGQNEGFITGVNIFETIPAFVKDRIVVTGKISKKSLRTYYQNATCLVFPSVYEGFGLPILEALATSCPVLASDIPIFKEIGKDALIYFNPNDAFELSQKMLSLANAELETSELRQNGSALVQNFNWDKTTCETYQYIKTLI